MSATKKLPAGSPEQEHDLNCLTIAELEKLAYVRMDKQTRDYYNEGADAGLTLSENGKAYKKYRIRPRALRDVSRVDTSVNIFGHRNAVPFGVAPTAMQGLAHHDGELATARACREAGIIMGLSSFSTSTVEAVAEASGDNPNVLQLYLFEDRNHSKKLIDRAKAAGFKALLLTVDTPMLGRRNLEIRNQFKLPKHLKVANFTEEVEDPSTGSSSEPSSSSTPDPNTSRPRKKPASGPSRPPHHDSKTGERHPPSGPITFHTHAANPTLTWEESIPWLKKVASPMQVWVKGLLCAEDAQLAVQHGADGILVSNHGGRQLDGALATLDALPAIAEAVKGRIPIHIDGGIRQGTDIFKALALGADFCWVGRPILWGLAYDGEKGVTHCLRLLTDEFKLCMGLAGVTRVGDIDKDYLAKIDRDGFVSKL